MTGRTERRVREIRRRTRQYRKRHERRVLSTLSVCSLLLFAEIGILLRKVQSGGVPTVGDSDHDLHPMQKEKNDPHGGCGR